MTSNELTIIIQALGPVLKEHIAKCFVEHQAALQALTGRVEILSAHVDAQHAVRAAVREATSEQTKNLELRIASLEGQLPQLPADLMTLEDVLIVADIAAITAIDRVVLAAAEKDRPELARVNLLIWQQVRPMLEQELKDLAAAASDPVKSDRD